jgi:hypothetical protein
MFSATNQPPNNGRPKGSRNKLGQFSQELAEQALEQLTLAVNQGESWAIQEVLKRISPTLKPITPEESLDGGQSHDEAFNIYQAKRTAEGYKPLKGWEQLKAEFLSENNGVDNIMFITFDVLDSVAPRPPIVTNAKQSYELKVI